MKGRGVKEQGLQVLSVLARRARGVSGLGSISVLQKSPLWNFYLERGMYEKRKMREYLEGRGIIGNFGSLQLASIWNLSYHIKAIISKYKYRSCY